MTLTLHGGVSRLRRSTMSNARHDGSAAAGHSRQGHQDLGHKGGFRPAIGCSQNSFVTRISHRNLVWRCPRIGRTCAHPSTRLAPGYSPSTPRSGRMPTCGSFRNGTVPSISVHPSVDSARHRKGTRLCVLFQPSIASRIQRCRCMTGCSEFTPPLGSTTRGPGR